MVNRSTLVVALAALLWPATASAQVCKFKPEQRLSPAERELRYAIGARKELTLPHGRSFVRRVNADAAARRRGAGLLYFAVTEREAAYLRLRSRVADASDAIDAYVRRHRDTYAGTSIEDDYPRSPYVLVRFTRDLAKHRRAIARRFPHRFVVARSRYTERRLRAIADRIEPRQLAREGINALHWGPHRDRVELAVTTRRADAAAVVRRLYGPAIVVRVVAAEPTYLACNPPETYRVEPDGRTLTLTYVDSGSVEPRHVEVVEGPGEVRVGMVSEVPHGGVTSDGVTYTLSVTLSEPLGDREVRSITTGGKVRQEQDEL